MNNPQQEVLQSLRNAVEQDDWKVFRENVAKLLPTLEQTEAVKIITGQAQRFLDDMAHFHPADETLSKTVEAFNNITSLEALDHQGKLTDILLQNYWNWPGVSNFRNSLKGISKPEQYYEHSGEYKDTILSLISGILMAAETNTYWGGNTEFSETFFGADTQKSLLMLVKGHNDPRNVAIRKSSWTEIADEIEAVLHLE